MSLLSETPWNAGLVSWITPAKNDWLAKNMRFCSIKIPAWISIIIYGWLAVYLSLY